MTYNYPYRLCHFTHVKSIIPIVKITDSTVLGFQPNIVEVANEGIETHPIHEIINN
jgi:hypothetical protein